MPLQNGTGALAKFLSPCRLHLGRGRLARGKGCLFLLSKDVVKVFGRGLETLRHDFRHGLVQTGRLLKLAQFGVSLPLRHTRTPLMAAASHKRFVACLPDFRGLLCETGCCMLHRDENPV